MFKEAPQMSLAKQLPLCEFGDIKGLIYFFEDAGDILPKHVHTEEDNHITVVMCGAIKAYSHDWEVEVKAGHILDFRPNEPHEFMALEPGTKIFNIVKKLGGVPNDSMYPPVLKEMFAKAATEESANINVDEEPELQILKL
jgi:hypothetical protein